jgi:hypothetical protein
MDMDMFGSRKNKNAKKAFIPLSKEERGAEEGFVESDEEVAMGVKIEPFNMRAEMAEG